MGIKELIQEKLDEAIQAKYEYKSKELLELLYHVNKGHDEDIIKSRLKKIEEKRPFIM